MVVWRKMVVYKRKEKYTEYSELLFLFFVSMKLSFVLLVSFTDAKKERVLFMLHMALRVNYRLYSIIQQA